MPGRLQETFEKTLACLAVPPLDTTIRVGLHRTSRETLITKLQELGVQAAHSSPLYSVCPDLVVVAGSGPHAVEPGALAVPFRVIMITTRTLE